MKKILIIGLTLIFVFYIGTSMSLALIIDLFDWAFYVDGTIYKFTEGDTMLTTGTFDSSGLGTLTWSINNAGSHNFIAFFDHEIDESENTSFNEYGTSHQPLASGQS